MPRTDDKEILQLVLTPEAKAAIRTRAKSLGLEMSEYIRRLVQMDLGRSGDVLRVKRGRPRVRRVYRRRKPDAAE